MLDNYFNFPIPFFSSEKKNNLTLNSSVIEWESFEHVRVEILSLEKHRSSRDVEAIRIMSVVEGMHGDYFITVSYSTKVAPNGAGR